MTKKLLVVFLVLAIASLACNLPLSSGEENTAVPKELTTPTNSESFLQQTDTPEAPTPTLIQPKITYEKAQIGVFTNLYLTYDPSIWEAARDPYESVNSEGQVIYRLNHRKFNCTLEANLGMGVPDTWQRFVSEKKIGELIFQVETWRDTTTNMEVLVVYQYPAVGQRENATRIEVIIKDHPKECISDAEAVLGLSEEEIR
jgi:hypothetical protein